ncbi:glycoside hydrolase family 125 protein [Microbulbifer sp. Q7]|uniref:glycoside hydrolase family 125 protein n=1 Tax=Microbulbifer sp. Q7 TaxID=1785091 RepID=UPI001D114E35|nr:glycoside hydrolase family 125 protein [Microbulbifer sp. Q7]
MLLKQGAGLLGLALAPIARANTVPGNTPLAPGADRGGLVSNRPPVSQRTFTSSAVENSIERVSNAIKNPELRWLFENCYPNTLDTTVDFEWIDGKPDTFIITGDIDAMWLRDSTAQVWPYMSLINEDEKIRNLIGGLVNRQVKCILRDPYANAFYKDLSKESQWASDEPTPIDGVHERKWEIDSLCYVIRLSDGYYRATGDTSIFDEHWQQAMQEVLKVFRTEQRKQGESPYRFVRVSGRMIDAPVFEGTGRPVNPVGLIASAFRPSDDATVFPFLVPSNIFAMLSLRQLASVYADVLEQPEAAATCLDFANELDQAIQAHCVAEHQGFGKIYAYEVDGFGNKLFMDDANVPSLMSLAYLDPAFADDPIYQNTRRFLLSDSNPYFLRGTAAEGQGSPHTGKEKIWPMGIILRAMTASDEKEIIHCLRMLKNTHADTGFMHEAFHKDDPKDFNRAWFAWANTLFGELLVNLQREKPEILAMRNI